MDWWFRRVRVSSECGIGGDGFSAVGVDALTIFVVSVDETEIYNENQSHYICSVWRSAESGVYSGTNKSRRSGLLKGLGSRNN